MGHLNWPGVETHKDKKSIAIAKRWGGFGGGWSQLTNKNYATRNKQVAQ